MIIQFNNYQEGGNVLKVIDNREGIFNPYISGGDHVTVSANNSALYGHSDTNNVIVRTMEEK